MSSKKKTATTADAVERLPHRYPTRFKLRQDTTTTTTDAVEKLPRHHSFPISSKVCPDSRMTTAEPVEKLSRDRCHPTSSKLCRNTLYFPREVIYNILIFVPAKSLFHAMRYVCKQWYDIVTDPDFITANCQTSTPGYLIQEEICPDNNHNDLIIHIEADTTTLNDATRIQIPSHFAVVSCFNGLVLLLNTSSTEKLLFHVANPMTKENISLPPLESLPSTSECTVGLGVDSSSHYKVVYASGHSGTSTSNGPVKLRVFTIGVDKSWRFIDDKDIPVNCEVRKAVSYCPQSLGGFMYWCTYYYHTTCRRYGFALDLDTETIYQFSQPKDVVKNSAFAFVSMGTSLGFIASERGCIWRLWKLTDVKSGEWTELAHINVSTLYSRFDEVFDPCVNMLYSPVKLFGGQLWFYRDIKGGNAVVRYNFVNDSMVVFPIKRSLDHQTLLSHTNTLVSPKKL